MQQPPAVQSHFPSETKRNHLQNSLSLSSRHLQNQSTMWFRAVQDAHIPSGILGTLLTIHIHIRIYNIMTLLYNQGRTLPPDGSHVAAHK
ncbi:hypothetical protein BJX62DRAFT_218803 [Aspergillus germanicus]